MGGPGAAPHQRDGQLTCRGFFSFTDPGFGWSEYRVENALNEKYIRIFNYGMEFYWKSWSYNEVSFGHLNMVKI